MVEIITLDYKYPEPLFKIQFTNEEKNKQSKQKQQTKPEKKLWCSLLQVFVVVVFVFYILNLCLFTWEEF